jgi:hypothetical protein
LLGYTIILTTEEDVFCVVRAAAIEQIPRITESVESSFVGRSHGKLVVDTELEASL